MKIHPRAGLPATTADLVNVPKLITAYYEDQPDPHSPGQEVVFGTSGHRGSSFERSFNEWHILAITQSICLYRQQQRIDGPLFIGIDTHALSRPAFESAVRVLAANGVDVTLAERDEFTPTPVISHAILTYNGNRKTGLSDGIVITPSHNPPEWGGFKYNPPHGGPADGEVTKWIETKANSFLAEGLKGIKRMPFAKALSCATTHTHDYLTAYGDDLGDVIDMEVIAASGITLGVDPLGGAGVHYWGQIAQHYGLNLKVVNQVVDPTFRYMTLDWDGQIRMDPSSSYAMRSLISLKDKYDIGLACDTDHDRHGIVTRNQGLLPPNHYLAACIHYLFTHRPQWSAHTAVGKTVVSSSMIDRVAAKLGRKLYEVPVGFKYFVDGLLESSLGFAGEESAGASFLRREGSVWTTDKDGIIAALLAAEMTAKTKNDPGQIYQELTLKCGDPLYERTDAPATNSEREALLRIGAQSVQAHHLAGEKIISILTKAPGDGKSISGITVTAPGGWFAARPSGTEAIYKIYAESFNGKKHLLQLQTEAQDIISRALALVPSALLAPSSGVPGLICTSGDETHWNKERVWHEGRSTVQSRS